MKLKTLVQLRDECTNDNVRIIIETLSEHLGKYNLRFYSCAGQGIVDLEGVFYPFKRIYVDKAFEYKDHIPKQILKELGNNIANEFLKNFETDDIFVTTPEATFGGLQLMIVDHLVRLKWYVNVVPNKVLNFSTKE